MHGCATDNNHQARYYRLTAAGLRALGSETGDWRRYVAAVDRILAAT